MDCDFFNRQIRFPLEDVHEIHSCTHQYYAQALHIVEISSCKPWVRESIFHLSEPSTVALVMFFQNSQLAEFETHNHINHHILQMLRFFIFPRFFIYWRKVRILQIFIHSNAKIAQLKSMVLMITQPNCNVFTCVKYFIICARIMRILSDTNFRSCNMITCMRLICSLCCSKQKLFEHLNGHQYLIERRHIRLSR